MLMVVSMLAAVISGCKKKEAGSQDVGSSSKQGGYKGELTIMHFNTSEESEGNGGSDGFRTTLDQWCKDHPNIKLKQNVLAADDYKTQITTLAAAGDLPDIFFLQGCNTAAWAKQKQILDLTDSIKSSPYYDKYVKSYFTPFTTADGKIYGYPVLTGGTCTVVIYDSNAWKQAGFETFPKSWDDVEKASKFFKEQGKDTIAFGNGSKWQANSCFISTLGDRYTGPDWFKSIINKDGAKFTDEGFVNALRKTQYLFKDTNIFNADFNAIDNGEALEYYISGDAVSFIGGNWDVSYVYATLNGTELGKNTKFAALPQPNDAKFEPNSQNIGLGFSMAINSKLAENPDKMNAAIDLAQTVTGPDFSVYVAKNYALGGLTDPGEIDLSKFDQFTQDFYNWSYVDTTPCEIYDSYLTSSIWDIFNTDLQMMLNGDITPEEVAANVQKAYEKDY